MKGIEDTCKTNTNIILTTDITPNCSLFSHSKSQYTRSTRQVPNLLQVFPPSHTISRITLSFRESVLSFFVPFMTKLLMV